MVAKKPLTDSEWDTISQTYSTVTTVSSLSLVFPWDLPPMPPSLEYRFKNFDELQGKRKPKPVRKFVEQPSKRVIDLGD